MAEKIIPYITKDEVKQKIRNLLKAKGYSEGEIQEDVVLEVADSAIVIDFIVKPGTNKILILCDSPSETITITARLSVLISKVLDPPPRLAIATNWMESEITDLLNGKKWFSLKIPSKEETTSMQNPKFEFSEENREKIEKLISGLYSMKCTKCWIKFNSDQ